MPLTPQEVHDKLFTSVRFAKGYDEDEVDAFLDEVEAELTRLLAENEELRRRSGMPQLGTGATPGSAALAAAPPAVAALEPLGLSPLGAPSETEDMLRRTLLLAQRTADEAIAEARAEAHRIVSTASEQAASVDREAQARVTAMTSDLEERRAGLEARVEQLRAFEREYRTRLRAYLEMQLRELDSAPPASPAEVPGLTSGGDGVRPGLAAGGAGGRAGWAGNPAVPSLFSPAPPNQAPNQASEQSVAEHVGRPVASVQAPRPEPGDLEE